MSDRETDHGRLADPDEDLAGKRRSPGGIFLRWYPLAALALLAAVGWMARAGIEPIATWLYPIAWWLLIFALDGITFRRKGESLLASGGHEVILLLLVSLSYWLLYEIADARLQNWYYVYVPVNPGLRVLAYLVSFATVLPALFVVADLLESLFLFQDSGVPLARGGAKTQLGLLVAGGGSLLLALAFPTYCYPLIWFAPFFLAESYLLRSGDQSLARDALTGRTRRIKLLLLSGILCGLCWESLNGLARSGWRYDTPGVDEPYFFHMPVVGLIGFLPFALSSYSFYILANSLLGGGGFRLAEWPVEREERLRSYKSTNLPGSRRSRAVGLICLIVLVGVVSVERANVDSLRPTMGDLGATEEQMTILRAYGLDDPFKLAERASGGSAAALIMDRGLPMGKISELVARASLMTQGGIGPRNARLLREFGIDRMELLAETRPDQLALRLRRTNGPLGLLRRPPRKGKVGNWIRAAQSSLAIR